MIDNNLIEFDKDGQPTVTSLKIAEEFGREHKHVLESIRRECAEEIDRSELRPTPYVDSQGREQPMFRLNERLALFVMPLVHSPGKVSAS